MKAKIRDEWDNLLESKKYKQGRGKLKYGIGPMVRYCCLGILCEMHAEETGGKWETDTHNGYTYHYLNRDRLPARDVLEWAGLNHKKIIELAILNDAGTSFSEIAKQVRAL